VRFHSWCLSFVLLLHAFVASPALAEEAECSPPLWYNGDGDPRWFTGGMFTNNISDLHGYAEIVFEDFEVTSPDGWTITSVWSNNFTNARHVIVEAEWQIRRDVVPGQVGDGGGGEWVAGGRSPASQVLRMPACVDGWSDGVEATVIVNGLQVELPPGRYYVGVAPVLYELDQSLPTDTLGGTSNAVGNCGLADNAFALRRNPDHQFFDDQPANSEVFVRADYGSANGAPNYSVGVGGFETGTVLDVDSCLSGEERCLRELSECSASLDDPDALLAACDAGLDECTVASTACSGALSACETSEADCVAREAVCLGRLTTAEASLQACVVETSALTAQVDEMLQAANMKDAQLEAMQDELARLEVERAALVEERDALWQEVWDLEAAVSTSREERDALAAAYENALASVAALEAERETLAAALATAEASVTAALLELDDLQGQLATLADTVDAMGRELEEGRGQTDALRAENVALSDALAAESGWHEGTRALLADRELEVDELSGALVVATAAHEELSARLASVEAERDAAEQRASSADAARAALEDEMEALRLSLDREIQRSSQLELALRTCEEGASTDADRDGAPDAGDRCPRTDPAEKVDELGCSRAQHCGLQADASSCRLAQWNGVRSVCRWRAVGFRRFRCVPADR
jgi:predicted nuclease with TOPRIM domain